jgi:DNA-binding transcriptional LysR family regulator
MARAEYNDLAAFAAVARARSFTRAAAGLGMSPSALSHAMRGLEDRLGVRLLARTTRSVAPTEAGAHLLRAIGPAMDDITEAVSTLAAFRQHPSGTVRLTASTICSRDVLEPRLPQFLRDNPDVGVEVNVDDHLTDIVAAGFDAGIRFGDSVAKDMLAVQVGPHLRLIVVGTTDYFDRYPAPSAIKDLEHHRCITYRLPSSGDVLKWDFEDNGRDVRVRVGGPLVANDGYLMLAAVRGGVGLGYVFEQDVAEEIADGRLIQVLADYCPPFAGAHLYHPSRRQMTPALKALIAAMRWTAPGR